MEKPDVRWMQRFQNFENAFLKLSEAIEQKGLNELERNGLIQRFEFTIDLSWKVMKDFLEEKGFAFKPAPKDTFRLAQQSQYIDFAQTLIDGLDIRNDVSHDYSLEKFEKAELAIRDTVFPVLVRLYQFYQNEIQKNEN
jgi:nucleotidyltransferase substrate binding protein (TIGR01987 family)